MKKIITGGESETSSHRKLENISSKLSSVPYLNESKIEEFSRLNIKSSTNGHLININPLILASWSDLMRCLLQEINQNDVENIIIISDFSIKELKTMKNFITKSHLPCSEFDILNDRMPIEISNLFLSFGIDLKSCLKQPNENSAPYVKKKDNFSSEIKSEIFEKVNENSIDDDNAYISTNIEDPDFYDSEKKQIISMELEKTSDTPADEKSDYNPKKNQKNSKKLRKRPKNSIESVNRDEDSKNLICDVCGKVCNMPSNLLQHMKSHEPKGDFGCSQCKKYFKTESILNSHFHRQHEKLTCTTCGKNYKGTAQLKNHSDRVHGSSELRRCEKCGKGFKSLQNLKIHLQEFHNKIPCKHCGEFYGPGYMENHVKMVHIQDNSWLCEKCEHKFHTKTQLLSHIKATHEKIVCKFCGKSFNNYNLKVHIMQVHEMERPYKCDICLKGFVDLKRYQIHMNTHTGNKPFKCEFCCKAFADSSNRRMHVKIAHEGFKRTK